jgi:hypothetical protein
MGYGCVNLIQLAQDRVQWWSSCDHDSNMSDSIKGWTFLHLLSHYQLFNKDFDPSSCF